MTQEKDTQLITERLKQFIAGNGTKMLEDKAKCRGLVNDLFPDIEKKYRNTILLCVSEGIVTQIITNTDGELTVTRSIRELTDNYAMSAEVAGGVVRAIDAAIHGGGEEKKPATTAGDKKSTGKTAGQPAPKADDSRSVKVGEKAVKNQQAEIPAAVQSSSVSQDDKNLIIEYGTVRGVRSKTVTSITIPDSVTSIGWNAFEGCTGLTSITIPDSVTSIDWNAFEGCTGLTSITIPASVTSIGNEAFSNCTGLTSITIPTSVTSIGRGAFSDCTGLTSITVDKNNTVYHSAGNCLIKIKSKTIIVGCKNSVIPTDGSVTSIDDYAFSDCTGLTSITIPDSVTSIDEGAFSKCTGLTSITIPTSVTSIGECAFHNCTGLTSITIPTSVTSIGSDTFSDCTGLTSITIPTSVTSIGNYAFSDCTSLTSITIPTSVTSIGNNAFYKCTGLTSITIPDSVTSIGDKAFFGCKNLTIYCAAPYKPFGWYSGWNYNGGRVVWNYKG